MKIDPIWDEYLRDKERRKARIRDTRRKEQTNTKQIEEMERKEKKRNKNDDGKEWQP